VESETTKLLIRDANQGEFEQVLELTKKAYAEYQPDSPESFWNQYIENITAAILRGPEIERVVAFADEEMVGSVLLCAHSMKGDWPEIRLLAVAPESRGLGVGRALMDACENRLISRGVDTVVLHTTHLMNTARAMYERSGYVRREEFDFRPVPEFLVMGYVKQLVPIK